MDNAVWQWWIANRHPVWEPLFLLLHWVGQPWVVFLIAAVFAFWRKRPVIVVAVGAAEVVNAIAKRIIDRPRPDPAYAWVVEHSPSLPSGHVAATAALIVALWLTGTRRWWMWAAIPLMMVDRLYLGVHWFTDTLAGLAVGALVAAVCARR